MPKKKNPEKVSDLIFDDKNFNLGNPFGEGLIEKSFAKFGAARSVLIDRNNRIIAGNKSTQKFAEGGGENVIVVETDGKTLVAVKRTDIDLDTPEGRELALADNQTASKNIVMDAVLIEATLGEAVCEEWGITKGVAEPGEGIQLGDQSYVIEVKCISEREQEKLFKELEKKGYECRLLTL